MQLVETESPIGSFLEVLAGLRQGRTLEEIARKLEISNEALELWVKGLDILAATKRGHSEDSAEHKELQRLRQENEYLRKQRDFYRRACGLVSPPPESRDGERTSGLSVCRA